MFRTNSVNSQNLRQCWKFEINRSKTRTVYGRDLCTTMSVSQCVKQGDCMKAVSQEYYASYLAMCIEQFFLLMMDFHPIFTLGVFTKTIKKKKIVGFTVLN